MTLGALGSPAMSGEVGEHRPHRPLFFFFLGNKRAFSSFLSEFALALTPPYLLLNTSSLPQPAAACWWMATAGKQAEEHSTAAKCRSLVASITGRKPRPSRQGRWQAGPHGVAEGLRDKDGAAAGGVGSPAPGTPGFWGLAPAGERPHFISQSPSSTAAALWPCARPAPFASPCPQKFPAAPCSERAQGTLARG